MEEFIPIHRELEIQGHREFPIGNSRWPWRDNKAACGHVMPRRQYACNGLASPARCADESMLARDRRRDRYRDNGNWLCYKFLNIGRYKT